MKSKNYNPDIHHRRSIRLKGYDYSQAGFYFVTICVQNHRCLFGKIKNGQMVLNPAGQMVEKWCSELSNKFPDIILDKYVIMPNHFHVIIVNTGNGNGNGNNNDIKNKNGNIIGADLRVCPHNHCEHKNNILGEHVGSPLHAVVQWFKTMTTNAYIRGVKTFGWQRFEKKLWQRNYWEHIIRNDNAYLRIAKYIVDNPEKWWKDKFHRS
jgi:REP element-mobilizing transposase RayT